DHALRHVVRDLGLPKIRSHDQHLSRHVPNKHFSEADHRCKTSLSIATRETDQPSADTRGKSATNDVLLEVPKLHRLTSTVPLRNNQILLTELQTPLRTILRPTLEIQWLRSDLRLRTRHNNLLP